MQRCVAHGPAQTSATSTASWRNAQKIGAVYLCPARRPPVSGRPATQDLTEASRDGLTRRNDLESIDKAGLSVSGLYGMSASTRSRALSIASCASPAVDRSRCPTRNALPGTWFRYFRSTTPSAWVCIWRAAQAASRLGQALPRAARTSIPAWSRNRSAKSFSRWKTLPLPRRRASAVGTWSRKVFSASASMVPTTFSIVSVYVRSRTPASRNEARAEGSTSPRTRRRISSAVRASSATIFAGSGSHTGQNRCSPNTP